MAKNNEKIAEALKNLLAKRYDIDDLANVLWQELQEDVLNKL